MNRREFISTVSAASGFSAFTSAAQQQTDEKLTGKLLRLEIHFDQPGATLRALHGANKGPLTGGGLIDLTEAQRALHIPWTRLHDCHFPNPDVVDMHAVFPRAEANPALESSYDFARTDAYLEGVRATGGELSIALAKASNTSRSRNGCIRPRTRRAGRRNAWASFATTTKAGPAVFILEFPIGKSGMSPRTDPQCGRGVTRIFSYFIALGHSQSKKPSQR